MGGILAGESGHGGVDHAGFFAAERCFEDVRFVDEFFYFGERERRHGGEARGELCGFFAQLGVFCDERRQAELFRLFRRQLLGQHHKALRLARACEAREQEVAAAVRDKADGAESLREFRIFRGAEEVAGERYVEARAGGGAVHHSYVGLRGAHYGERDAARRFHIFFGLVAAFQRGERRQVAARAEGAPRAGQHDGADFSVALAFCEGFDELGA